MLSLIFIKSAMTVYSMIYLEQHKQEHMCALAFLPEEAFSSSGGLGWKGGEEERK